jgi:hypothetical protein
MARSECAKSLWSVGHEIYDPLDFLTSLFNSFFRILDQAISKYIWTEKLVIMPRCGFPIRIRTCAGSISECGRVVAKLVGKTCLAAEAAKTFGHRGVARHVRGCYTAVGRVACCVESAGKEQKKSQGGSPQRYGTIDVKRGRERPRVLCHLGELISSESMNESKAGHDRILLEAVECLYSIGSLTRRAMKSEIEIAEVVRRPTHEVTMGRTCPVWHIFVGNVGVTAQPLLPLCAIQSGGLTGNVSPEFFGHFGSRHSIHYPERVEMVGDRPLSNTGAETGPMQWRCQSFCLPSPNEVPQPVSNERCYSSLNARRKFRHDVR